ncbi:MAG: tetratricopeptide repeat protein [Treponema sp.]|nr:tetratricopeptide repeat protein [Treponema sp.]
MLGIFRKLLFIQNLFRRQKPLDPEEIIEEKWTANFSKEKHTRFNIKSDASYDSSIKENLFYPGHSLVISLKKTGCIAWVEAPERRYRDLIISGALRIDTMGGYGAGGIFFRMVDERTYYSFLISNKGYFRLDAVRNGTPFALIGWTEIPLSQGAMMLNPSDTVDFSLVAYGSRIIVLIRGTWAAEINDSSILEGCICFAAASYDSGDPAYRAIRDVHDVSYSVEVFLESITLDSFTTSVMELYEKWHESEEIDSRARMNLAETFSAMDQHNEAMLQLRKSWDREGHRKTQEELLLAGRLAQLLGLAEDAEKYIAECFEQDLESHEGKEAVVEMAKILYSRERYKELKKFCNEAVKIKPDDPVLRNFSGHAHWELSENKQAASAYDLAFKLDKKNGIYAKNAANVYEVMENYKFAMMRYIEAGRAFLKAGNYNDLGLITPKLLSLGEQNWEARCLAGKWAFAVEDWKMAAEEFEVAEGLRKAKRPRPKKDGALVFLEALLLIRAGKRKEALPLLEEAVSLQKEYALFRFRLAECIFLLNDDPDDEKMLRELNSALSLSMNEDEGFSISKDNEGLDGWINNFAAQIALRKGNLELAAKRLERAIAVLGDLPAVRVNQGVLYSLQGSLDKALELLDVDKRDDPEGIMVNCAGNLLYGAGRFEEADSMYRRALSALPESAEYLCNRASCLLELGLYGEADDLLARAQSIAPSPSILEMVGYVAAKKGEYRRAEQACMAALEMDPNHAPSLLSLGWMLITAGRHSDAEIIMNRLDKLNLKNETAKSREELKARLDEEIYRIVDCSSCERNWKVLKDPPAVPTLRLYAMPPDDLPAGSCPTCGKTYCIACAKTKLDPQGRFICPSCEKSLKLVNEGIKKIIHDWAVKDGLIKAKK